MIVLWNGAKNGPGGALLHDPLPVRVQEPTPKPRRSGLLRAPQRRGASRGEDNYRAKLTDQDVRTIRQRREAGEYLKVIAKDYGIQISQVWAIAHGKGWAHVR